jgi:hypothetical protein
MNRQTLKTPVLVGLFTLLAVLASSYVLFFYAMQAVEEDIREYLQGVASAVSEEIDVDLHTLFQSRTQETSPEYLGQIAKLGKIQKAFGNISFIYTCIMKEGKIYFIPRRSPPQILQPADWRHKTFLHCAGN